MQSKQVWIITDKKKNKNQNTTPKIWLLKQSQFMRNASFGNGKKRRCDWPALISHGEESDETKKQQETVDSRLAQNIFQLLKTKSYWHKFTRFWAIWLILKASPTLRIRTLWRERMWQRNREDWKANGSTEVHTQPQDRGLGCLVRSALAVDDRRTLLDFSRVIVDDGEILRHSEGERGGGLGLMPRMLFTSRFLNESLGLRSPSGHCKHGPV